MTTKLIQNIIKKTTMENVGCESSAFCWKVSKAVLSKIEGKSKTGHYKYLSANPFAARE